MCFFIVGFFFIDLVLLCCCCGSCKIFSLVREVEVFLIVWGLVLRVDWCLFFSWKGI